MAFHDTHETAHLVALSNVNICALEVVRAAELVHQHTRPTPGPKLGSIDSGLFSASSCEALDWSNRV